MNLPIDDQHGSGLGRVSRGRRTGEIAAGLSHARGLIADPEHAVRLHVKIRRAAARVRLVQLALVLDVKADGKLVLAEHAGVHGEGELLALRLQRGGKRVHRSIRLVIRSTQEQANIVMAGIERADDELGAVKSLGAHAADAVIADSEREKRA